MVGRTDGFKTSLIYRPSGESIWVTLDILCWNWYGIAEQASGKWNCIGGALSYNASLKSQGMGINAYTELPTWIKNATELELEKTLGPR